MGKEYAVAAALLLSFSAVGQAVVLDFENITSPTNVSPTAPYFSFGFMLTPTNAASDIAANVILGDASYSFNFQGQEGLPNGPYVNPITLTGPGTFDFSTFIAGRTGFAPSVFPTLDLSVTGYFLDGTTQTRTFTGLTNATLETLDWTHLTDVVFVGSTDAGIDDLSLTPDSQPTPIPEPASLAFLLLASGTLGTICSVRKI